jgi:hypothetical protein
MAQFDSTPVPTRNRTLNAGCLAKAPRGFDQNPRAIRGSSSSIARRGEGDISDDGTRLETPQGCGSNSPETPGSDASTLSRGQCSKSALCALSTIEHRGRGPGDASRPDRNDGPSCWGLYGRGPERGGDRRRAAPVVPVRWESVGIRSNRVMLLPAMGAARWVGLTLNGYSTAGQRGVTKEHRCSKRGPNMPETTVEQGGNELSVTLRGPLAEQYRPRTWEGRHPALARPVGTAARPRRRRLHHDHGRAGRTVRGLRRRFPVVIPLFAAQFGPPRPGPALCRTGQNDRRAGRARWATHRTVREVTPIGFEPSRV